MPKFFYHTLSLSLLASLLSMSSVAEIQTKHSTTLNTLNQAQHIQNVVSQGVNVQDINEQHSQVDKWSEWGLTHEEWTRYEALMKGPRGIWTPTLDPLVTLGVEARSESERQHFAELLAKKEFQRAEKEIAFQIAYNQAFQKLYPNILPFRMDESNQTLSSAENRVIYFTRTDCESCRDDLRKIMDYAKSVPLDIYVVDSEQKDDKIRDWAVKNNIDIDKVRRRQITLNHDNGKWFKYAKGKMPVAYQVKGDGQWERFVY
ncbi:TIGR03759 family integrating conjugative element protein [Avibacterium sp. 21-599]|uniref:TIGR03759 family integrating conjugative element protein n=1 Tax=Avibacterium sp. 21-599 TaxID=2911528 RepID=UPI0022482825|nr:TIGR03759 family integrating conjugative element protein [Avibacterium sp. 21-599]MCW9718558.1 TIGR03759 family integrating conjugative element protein [Avibacterium sp. 21-599]